MTIRLEPAWLGLALMCALGVFISPNAWAQESETPSEASYRATYNFDAPDATFNLPSSLFEVSGLTTLNDTLLGAVQDEQGVLYQLDARTGLIAETFRFGPDGDYEGLALVNDRTYALESNGRLTAFALGDTTAPTVYDLGRGLGDGCDAEGLAYEASSFQLFIPCKEYSGERFGPRKAVFSVDLTSHSLAPAPELIISTQEYNQRLPDLAINRTIRRIVTPLIDISGLKPSGIAIHPQTGERYILSSVRSSVLVVSPEGELKEVNPLPSNLLPAPEGITFLEDGTLFIASEGQSGSPARLVRYAPRP